MEIAAMVRIQRFEKLAKLCEVMKWTKATLASTPPADVAKVLKERLGMKKVDEKLLPGWISEYVAGV